MAKTPLRDPDIRRLRALAMLQRRLAGLSRSDIAAEFGCVVTTVDKEMDWARKQGLLVSYENKILEDLVPDAIKTVRAAVSNGDVKAALEVLKGTGLLTAKPQAPAAPQPEAETLEGYIRISRPVGGELDSRETAALPPERQAPSARPALNPASSPSDVSQGNDGQAPDLPPSSFAEGILADGGETSVPPD